MTFVAHVVYLCPSKQHLHPCSARAHIGTLSYGDYRLRTTDYGRDRNEDYDETHVLSLPTVASWRRCVISELLTVRARWVLSRQILYEKKKLWVRIWTEVLKLSITYRKNHIRCNFKPFWTKKCAQFAANSWLLILTAKFYAYSSYMSNLRVKHSLCIF